jgi:biopolymer transport protein ExbB/TolQ
VAEFFSERKHFKVVMPKFLAALMSAEEDGIPAVIQESGLLKRQKLALLTVYDYRMLPGDALVALIKRLVDEEESRYDRISGRNNMAARVSPMLGLMGTLIPLGPGIQALGSADTELLSASLLIAFDTTVAGLVVAAVCMVIGKIRSIWYANYMSALDSGMATMLQKIEDMRAEGKIVVQEPTDYAFLFEQSISSQAAKGGNAGKSMNFGPKHAAPAAGAEAKPADTVAADAASVAGAAVGMASLGATEQLPVSGSSDEGAASTDLVNPFDIAEAQQSAIELASDAENAETKGAEAEGAEAESAATELQSTPEGSFELASEPEPESESESATEPESESESATEPAAEPTTEPASDISPAFEFTVPGESEAAPEFEPASGFEFEPKFEPEPMSESGSAFELASETEPTPEPASMAEAESVLEQASASEPEPAPEPEPEPAPEPVAEPAPEPESVIAAFESTSENQMGGWYSPHLQSDDKAPAAFFPADSRSTSTFDFGTGLDSQNR